MDESRQHTRRGFDWNLLHTFLVIVDEGSITRAAERLLLRQPTVSNALKRLEEQLGRRLIDRGHGRFEPTEYGAVLYRECREICGTIGRLAQTLEHSASELTGDLHIHMASHVVFPPLDQALADFHTRHPQVTLEIEIATSSNVIDAVLAKTATLGICLVHERHPQLEYRLLFREHFGFFCGPNHSLFGRRDLQLEDLRGESFVSFKTDQLTDALRPVAILRAQLQMYGRVIGTSSNLEEVRRMIVAGLGIGPLPIHVVQRDVEAGLLWQLPPYESPPAIDIFLVTNPRVSLSRAERLFLDTLARHTAHDSTATPVFPDDAPASMAGAAARSDAEQPSP